MPDLALLKDRIFYMTNHLYTDTVNMTNMINDAQNMLTDGAKLEGSSSIAVISGTGSYALPATFKAPITLVKGTIAEPDQVYDLVSIDEFKFGYSIFESLIYLKPLPQETMILTLYYYKYATQLTLDTDTPEIDTQWHDLLSTYAAGMIALLLPDFDKGLADRYMQRWEEGKKAFKESMARKQKRTTVRQKIIW